MNNDIFESAFSAIDDELIAEAKSPTIRIAARRKKILISTIAACVAAVLVTIPSIKVLSDLNDSEFTTSDDTEIIYEEEIIYEQSSEQTQSGTQNNESVGTMMLWRFKFNKPGRTMSINARYNYSNNESDGFNKSETHYFQNNAIDSTAIVDQNVLKLERSNNINARFSYIEPLGKNFFVEGTYRYSYKKTNSDKNTYSMGNDGRYSVFDPTYSANYENVFITQQAELNFMKQEEKYNINIGASMQPSRTQSVGEGRDTSYSVINFSPIARIDYRFTDDKFLRVRYRGRTSQPSINQLMPVNDNSDPLKITVGNENLKPEFSHSLSTEYRMNNRQRFSFFNIGADFSYTQDDLE